MKSSLAISRYTASLRGLLVRTIGLLLAAGTLPAVWAEEPTAPATPATAPLRAADLECWEKGVRLVIGGWENSGYGVDWSFMVIEVLGPEEVDGANATAYRHRTLDGLEMSEYLRLRTMDDARFLKEFDRRHQADEGPEYQFWQRIQDGAVLYWDDDETDDYEKPDVMIPADLSTGSKFHSFGSDSVVVARNEALKGPWGEREAVRMDSTYPEEVEDDEVYPPYRVETWLGRGLSTVWTRSWQVNEENDDEEEETGEEAPAETLVSEVRLLRVIRPAAENPRTE
jgi:hypothetical protein